MYSDLEKVSSSEEKTAESVVGVSHAVRNEDFILGDSLYARIQRWANKHSLETRGVERVPEEERTDTSLLPAGSFWIAANLVVAGISTGSVGVNMGLSFWDSLLTIIFFNGLAAAGVAWNATFGPKTGLRQMVISRYWFGFHGAKIFAILNMINCVGWSAINTTVAAQMLHSLSTTHALPPWAGVLIITLLAFVLTLFGYKVVHMYEKYSWIPAFIIMFIIIGRLAISGNFTTGTLGVGKAEAGSVLSFGSVVFGSTAGWAGIASDYVVYQPKTVKSWKLFTITFVCIALPVFFVQLVGLACIMATQTSALYADNYGANGMGGLLYAILVPESLGNFGRFCLVVLALSTVGGTCPNTYSFGLSMQTLFDIFRRVPRVIWTLLSTCLFVGIAIPTYYSFEEYMEDFLDIMSYWVALYLAIQLVEHYLFRKGSMANYDLDVYDQADQLPPSAATVFAVACGVAGCVTGMSQTWYTGKLAKLAGGDIGLELCFGFAIIGFTGARALERAYFRR
ncbi:permease for cytosine/purines, uracil, thiamine, allantoin-domain-containing protein [Dipodascopsis tothii]|uniref:permease for cytosine/purines, uracil, thiamine, allantoin-domain-containing protein n=1 Tax=Dipodascopsis tothii TaxID=44089 RepID=UPI0034CE408F